MSNNSNSIDTEHSIDSIVYKQRNSIEYSITHIHIPSYPTDTSLRLYPCSLRSLLTKLR
jgi:hypothetical protein